MSVASDPTELYFGLFVKQPTDHGTPSLARRPSAPPSIPDPATGRALKIATLEGRARAICPSCAATGEGGFVSFVGDLRLAYACPACEQLHFLPGA